ncbi:MAG: PKD domain-containing protein, partial [Bacteroidales bacterium]|nr:PKD domain-containing protein [Bacteroidales bacterium]
MDTLRTVFASVIKYLISSFKKIDRYILFLIYGIFFLPTVVMAEGSKEIYIGNLTTGLYLCNDFVGHCGGNGDRTQFAIYDALDDDRLYFETLTNDEIVYMGFDGNPNNSGWPPPGTNYGIVYRIMNEDGSIAQDQLDLPTSGFGFINSIDEARVGPAQMYGALGYDALIFAPGLAGKYYIEFQRVDNDTPGQNTVIGNFSLDLFDITVADIANTAMPGRLYSKAWQFGWDPDQEDCSAKFYVYSTDSIITSLELNNMDGRVWFLYCNQTGVGTTGNFEQDRKSVNYQAYQPEYNIFLNEPDNIIFPPANILGSIIPPVIGQTHCDGGTIDFLLEVDKAGNVEIELDFDPPYVTRTLTTMVDAGVNTIIWDGYDGASPDSAAVPNNTNISFTVSYINGLTNLPLFDVEGNNNGFVIELVSPAGTTPLVYWDDSNLGGTTNFTGCASTAIPWSGCHPWNDGNNTTINTWWYTSSQTTAPVIIIQEREPDSLIFVQAPQSYCAGEQDVFISVLADPNTDVYHWDYTGSDFTIIDTDPTDPIIYINFGPLATPGNIEVYGTNSNCTDPGVTSTLFVTIAALPQPQIGILPNDTVCINETVTFIGTDNSGTNITSWAWDFGDGNTAGTQNASNIYSAVLTANVRLIAINDNGCTDTTYHNIWVTDPVVGFTISPEPACLGDTIFFTGTGDIVTYTDWNWDFGDGEFGTGRDTWHLYSGPNSYEVILTVCSKTVIDTAIVLPQAVADAGSSDTICQGDPYDFAFATVLADSSSCDSILWIGGMGTFNDPRLIHPVYYNDPAELGNVPLSLIAYGVLPCGNDTSTMILTIDSIPTGSFTYVPVDTCCVAELVSFNAASTCIINSWDWDFGDGTPPGTGQNTTHIYNYGDSTFTVSLTLLNNYGCTTTIIDSIYVDSVFTDFTMPTAICLEEIATFNGTGDNITFTDWEWNFGDGNTAIGRNVSHLYANSGIYNVTLIVCTDTTIKQITVNSLPESNFTMSPNDTSCMGELINFDATNITGDIILWDWQFGDGNIASGQNVTYTYNTQGNLNILSIYTNTNGCLDTTIHQRNVQDVNIGFNMVPTPSCQDYTVNFTGTGDLVTFTDWNWNFGDGSAPDLGHNVSHVYTTPDTVDVILDVCSEQSVQLLIINAACEVDAGSDEATCEDVYFDLSTSTIPPSADDFSSVFWYSHNGLGSFDDPYSITPTYFPDPNAGSIQVDTVYLYIVGYGIPPCENDTSFMMLRIIPGAYAFAGSDENSCFGDFYDFSTAATPSFATNYVTLYWTTSGTGSFVNPNVQQPIYIPGPTEIGPVTLTMVAV